MIISTAYLLSQRLLILIIVTVELLKRYCLPFVINASEAGPISITEWEMHLTARVGW